MLRGVLLTQVQITAGGGSKHSDDIIVDLANDILKRVPEVFDIEVVSNKYPVMYSNSMNTVLKQVFEIE